MLEAQQLVEYLAKNQVVRGVFSHMSFLAHTKPSLRSIL
jgi:hypothetical protein